MFEEAEKESKIKKVIIYVVIVVLAVAIILVSFIVSSRIMNKKITVSQKVEEENDIVEVNSIIPEHSVEMIKQYYLPVWSEETQERVRQIYFSKEKQVYLTFDDGPSELTPQILDILKQENVVATFFTLGSRVDLYPKITKRAYEEGHYIANHGFSHMYSSIYASPESVLEEYLSCENSIKNALGVEEYNSHFFRFPGGSSGGKYERIKTQAKKLLEENQVVYTNWNCLNGDAEGKKTEEELIARLDETIGDQTSLIILMHDASDKQTTVNTLKQVIEKFKSEDYEFKNFYEIFK